jgi:colanic acid/amylovoran biosynthesis glycosyltransferase
MNKNLLIFNKYFFSISESFIYNYIAGAINNYAIHLLSYNNRLNREIFPLTGKIYEHQLGTYFNFNDRIQTIFRRRYGGYSSNISLHYHSYIQSLIKNTPIDIVHAHYGPNGIIILPYAREENVPLVVTFHGYDASRSTKNHEYMSELQSLFGYASSIIIVSPHMVDTLKLEQYIDKVNLVPCGIDADFFTPTPTSEKNTIDILHVGRLVDKKGVPDLIRVFSRIEKRFKNVILHIVGDGKQLNECRKVALDLQVPEHKLKFHGAKPHSEIKRLLDKTDIFILNSRTSKDGNMEGLPTSILEAMSMEKAVISTYHAGIPYAIEHGQSGLLVPEKDNDALEAAIEKLYLDSERRIQLGKGARQTILEKFTVRLMQKKVNAVYESIL